MNLNSECNHHHRNRHRRDHYDHYHDYHRCHHYHHYRHHPLSQQRKGEINMIEQSIAKEVRYEGDTHPGQAKLIRRPRYHHMSLNAHYVYHSSAVSIPCSTVVEVTTEWMFQHF